MSDLKLQDAIEQLLDTLDIDVRHEHLGGEGGGLCQLKGRRVMFVDLDADTATRLERCVAALRGLPEIDGLYLSPALRERLMGSSGVDGSSDPGDLAKGQKGKEGRPIK